MPRLRTTLVLVALALVLGGILFTATRESCPDDLDACSGGGGYTGVMASTDLERPIFLLLSRQHVEDDDGTRIVHRRDAVVDDPEELLPATARITCEVADDQPPLGVLLRDGRVADLGPKSSFDRVVRRLESGRGIDCALAGQGTALAMTACGHDRSACTEDLEADRYACSVAERSSAPPKLSCSPTKSAKD